MSPIIRCPKCEHNNTEEDIDYRTMTCGASCGCEGYEYELICSSCGREIDSGGDWGEFDREEIAEEIVEMLNPKKQDVEKSSNKNRTLAPYGDSITIFGRHFGF